jgi:hypothetical protein
MEEVEDTADSATTIRTATAPRATIVVEAVAAEEVTVVAMVVMEEVAIGRRTTRMTIARSLERESLGL